MDVVIVELTEAQERILRDIMSEEEESGKAWVHPPSGTLKVSLKILMDHFFLFCEDKEPRGMKSRYCVTTKGKKYILELDRRNA